MDTSQMLGLMDLLGVNQMEVEPPPASTIVPHRSQAKPNMEVAVRKKKKKDEKPIWDDSEFKAQSGVVVKDVDDRAVPKYDILFRQNLGAEDVFMNLAQRDESSDHCSHIVVKIELPYTELKNISLDVMETRLFLQAPNYRLNVALPYRVKKDSGDAKWDKLKGVLSVTLPIDQKIKYYTKLEELYTFKDE
eukprot:GEMP01048312.1.p1 GENE.GEMP01048312.1~~GEMP01048312.1.p1  ORF type:complete len:191 (+),score=37.18 GEMP01048312.1:86-658(+)